MMSRTVPAPATGPRARGGLVAGVDLLTESERDADALLHLVGQRLSALGAAHGSVLATHWARADDVPHVALSLEVPSAGDAEGLWALLDEVLPVDRDRPGARCVGERRGGPAALHRAAEAAAQAHRTGASGRAVQFPGVERMVGTVSVRDVLDSTAIDAVQVLAQGPADLDAALVTRDFVRPRWRSGELVLDVQPAAGGALVPFEVPNPTPCCADHH